MILTCALALSVGHIKNSREAGGKYHAFVTRFGASRPTEHRYWTVEVHRRPRKNQEISSLHAQIADTQASKLEEVFSVATPVWPNTLEFQRGGIVILLFWLCFQDDSPATQYWPPQPKEETVARNGQSLHIDPIILARYRKKGGEVWVLLHGLK